MDYLWSPWRYQYLAGVSQSAVKTPSRCIFCALPALDPPPTNPAQPANPPEKDRDEAALIVHRGRFNFVILNRFPYTTGHLMVVPYQHAASLTEIDEPTATELFLLTRASERHLRAIYRPDGLNAGMNIGESAGAGIAGHIHMHVLPRWHGDANFMTTIGETRVLPEDLPTTWRRLASAFSLDSSGN